MNVDCKVKTPLTCRKDCCLFPEDWFKGGKATFLLLQAHALCCMHKMGYQEMDEISLEGR